ncbi:ParB/RepB/Spo0J family partition protein [Acuticoccus sp. MNP-M23]|uniref:ParB/RepB/Spo0J family partition protein n=1 Tax=Acuticoccus sp. MNP-M23 TaxID=3072793 RepID=UPI0028168A40|nr:ParB/RepB/Spo0J family partition protein [Acuticoccus sp. MNP-M23]WMS44287.1 ParB/RepB/Spo0J family partition protein [Acuticoccus sp. MNP-M23]
MANAEQKAEGDAKASARPDTRKRLGRGLSALLGDADTPGAGPQRESKNSKQVPIESLAPNPHNPRSSFEDEPLEELAQSIARHGMMQPIVVRVVDGHYEIIAGERRWRAAQRAGLHQVPVLVRNVTAGEALELALIENIQREGLNSIEEANGYQRLMAEFSHRQEDLAKLIGKSRSHVANTLRLLNLPPSIRASVADGSLTAGHARALIGADNAEALADEVISRGLSVRATEALVAAQANRVPKEPKPKPADDANTRALTKRLTDRLGLPVKLAHNADESGTLTIRYTSLDQLDEVCRMLGES